MKTSLFRLSNNAVIVVLLLILSLSSFFGFGATLKEAVPLYLVVSLILWLKLRNIVIVFFLIYIHSLQFFAPNKYYPIEAFRFFETNIYQWGSYMLGYGINLSNVFLALTLIAVSRQILTKPSGLSQIKRHTVYLVPSVLFLFIGIYSALQQSPYPEASLVWAFQYFQLYLVAATTLYVFITDRRSFSYLYTVLTFSLFLQGILSLRQFFSQSSSGSLLEPRSGSYISAGVDENDAIYRVSGTFPYHNQLALIVLTLISILTPVAFQSHSTMYISGIFSGLMVIVLTQSRSVWLGLFFYAILTYKQFKQQLYTLIRRFGFHRLVLYGTLVFAVISFIVFPRILLSVNSTYENAGLSLRQEMAEEGIAALLQSLYFGYGAGTNEYTLFSLNPDGVMSTFPAPIHLGFLQLALEFGLVGLAVFLLPFLWIAKEIISHRSIFTDKSSRNYAYVFIVGSLVFAVYYSLQPHTGVIEFPYLGLLCGFGLIALYLFHESHALHSK